MEKYKSGFTVEVIDCECSVWDMEWLFDEENTTENKLVFMGYDAVASLIIIRDRLRKRKEKKI